MIPPLCDCPAVKGSSTRKRHVAECVYADKPPPPRLPEYPQQLYRRLWSVSPGLYADLLIAAGHPDLIIAENAGYADCYQPKEITC